MIAFPSSVRVWLAAGRTDMRRGMISKCSAVIPTPAIFTCFAAPEAI